MDFDINHKLNGDAINDVIETEATRVLIVRSIFNLNEEVFEIVGSPFESFGSTVDIKRVEECADLIQAKKTIQTYIVVMP